MNTPVRKAPYSHEPGRCRRHGKILHCFLLYTNFITLLNCLSLKAHSEICHLKKMNTLEFRNRILIYSENMKKLL